MARILVQTNDHRTVLDERDVQLTDINDAASCVGLLDRLEQAIRDSEQRPGRASHPVRHLAAIVPTRDYREVRD
ncbi:MAG TPA: hypothetical protein VKG62_03780 [Solirubrobacteraceae bacterium]|nr:hypothetical protein [Solirubrobacteraceae bacterium]